LGVLASLAGRGRQGIGSAVSVASLWISLPWTAWIWTVPNLFVIMEMYIEYFFATIAILNPKLKRFFKIPFYFL